MPEKLYRCLLSKISINGKIFPCLLLAHGTDNIMSVFLFGLDYIDFLFVFGLDFVKFIIFAYRKA